MDDKTKVQMCRKLIENYWETRVGEEDEAPVILNAVQTVLEFKEEQDG